jgi:hypothetical protein
MHPHPWTACGIRKPALMWRKGGFSCCAARRRGHPADHYECDRVGPVHTVAMMRSASRSISANASCADVYGNNASSSSWHLRRFGPLRVVLSYSRPSKGVAGPRKDLRRPDSRWMRPKSSPPQGGRGQTTTRLSVRRVTASDALAAPILRVRVGEDVCRSGLRRTTGIDASPLTAAPAEMVYPSKLSRTVGARTRTSSQQP